MTYVSPSQRPIPSREPAKQPASFVKAKRRGVPADLAAKVFRRDGGRGLGCGEDRPERLSLDHIIPVAKGGSNRIGNLQTLCLGCTMVKRDHLTAAAIRQLHPEVKLEDLAFRQVWGSGQIGRAHV